MKRRRVVITGLGVVAPNGIGKDEFWRNLFAGKSAVDYITAFDPSPFSCQIAAEVKDFDPNQYIEPKKAKRLSRISAFAVASARMALEDAHLQIGGQESYRIGTCFGTTSGKPDMESEHLLFLEKGPQSVNPLAWAEFVPHASSVHIAIEFGIRGPATTISSGCCTSLDAVEWGALQIRSGRLAAAIVGSADSLLSPFVLAVLCKAGFLTNQNHAPTKASRPYDLYRDGFVPSEGAGAIVLEDLDHALTRNARIYAEVLGSAGITEGVEIPHRDVSGATLAQGIRTVLARSHLGIGEVDYINAHGVSHPESDLMETNAFKEVFGDHAYNIPISSIKSMIGDPFAAGGVLQIVAASLSLVHQIITPTLNLEFPDPQCDLDYVPQKARPARIRHLLVNSRAVGGSNSILALGRYN